MKVLKEYIVGIVFGLFEMIAGVLLLISPVRFTATIIMIAGVALLIMGLVKVVNYFRAAPGEGSLGRSLAMGLLYFLAGGFCLLKTEWFLATFPALSVLYGVAVLVAGISKIQVMVDMIRVKNGKWFWAAIDAALSILCAIILLRNPFSTTVALWIFAGISLIVEGILDIITLFVGRKRSDKAAA